MYYYASKRLELPNGQVEHRTHFDAIAKIEGAICEDGKKRIARTTSEPDTFFSIPAQVSLTNPKKTVSGFLTCEDGVWHFTATGRNARYIKGV